MLRYALSPSHYAFNWSSDQNQFSPDEITKLGRLYHDLPDGPAREEVFLQIVQAFHNYIVKYVDMICRGHLATFKWQPNRDSASFLSYFLAPGETPNKTTLFRICRTLHLAFIGQSYDEVYNILAGMIVKAVVSYDPDYAEKVKAVADAIGDGEDLDSTVFTAADLGLEAESDKQLRWLARKGYLETVKDPDPKTPRVIGYRLVKWLPKKGVLTSKPIGMTYHIQRSFKFALQSHITQKMGEIETRRMGGYQLEVRRFRPHLFRARGGRKSSAHQVLLLGSPRDRPAIPSRSRKLTCAICIGRN